MWSSLAISALLALSAVEASPQAKVIGGDDADPGEYPYFVQGPGCGGALVGDNMVLFAAHCEDLFLNQQLNIGAWRIDTADQGAQARFCDVWEFDPRFGTGCAPGQNTDINFDYALCKLDKPITSLANPKNISVAINLDDTVPEEGDFLKVMGFGDTNKKFLVTNIPEIIQETDVPYVTNQVCNQPGRYDGDITDEMLCAGYVGEGGKDACQGDSGGPLSLRETTNDGNVVDTIVGVVSWGIGCAEKKYPGVYSRVSKGADWIIETTCNTMNGIAPYCSGPPDPEPPCGGTELSVTVKTDDNPGATEWKLKDTTSGQTIFKRKFMVENLEYEHPPVCLAAGCYEFELKTDNNGLQGGFYSGDLEGEGEIFSGSGNFGKTAKHTFCTEGFEPPDPVCVDSDPEQCTTRLAQNTATKCGKIFQGSNVYDLCNVTCASVGLGPCA